MSEIITVGLDLAKNVLQPAEAALREGTGTCECARVQAARRMVSSGRLPSTRSASVVRSRRA